MTLWRHKSKQRALGRAARSGRRVSTNRRMCLVVTHLCSACIVLAMACPAMGCRGRNGGGGASGGPAVGASAGSARQGSSSEAGAVVRRSSRAFNFLVTQGGHIAVHDVTAGRTLLSTQVPPQTLVRVDPKTGVFTGTTQAIRGPLPENHIRELRVRP